MYIVLRPHVLSIYRDKNETKLRHQLRLSELTAVARQKDRKRQEKHVFALFSPARNFHIETRSEEEAQDWVDVISREAKFEEYEEEMFLASPGGASTTAYRGFERSIDAHISPGAEDRIHGGYASSSDAGEGLGATYALPKTQQRTSYSASHGARQPSFAEYSGAERGSFSDLSDLGAPTARLSALSLAQTDPRPSTSSAQPPHPNTIYGSTPTRPSLSTRNISQISGFGLHPASTDDIQRAQSSQDSERVLYHNWAYLLKSKSGVRQWKKIWLVLRPKALALYKNEEEYAPLLILPMSNIIDAVEVDRISRSKDHCMQVICEERNYRFCAMDEESLTRFLGATKSLLSKQKARRKEREAGGGGVVPVAVDL